MMETLHFARDASAHAMMNGRPQPSHMGLHGIQGGAFHGRYTPPYSQRAAAEHFSMAARHDMRRMAHNPPNNIFFEEGFLARAEALHELGKVPHTSPSGSVVSSFNKVEPLYGSPPCSSSEVQHSLARPHQMAPLAGFGSGDSMLEQLGVPLVEHGSTPVPQPPPPPQMYGAGGSWGQGAGQVPGFVSGYSLPAPGPAELDCDPRELEAFAEHFKQRRIKLGVTQADVGSALGKLKLPGVGSLSQSTICRFESLTLSHNNMVALRPVLQAWLEGAEQDARDRREQEGDAADRKRKRTSIAAAEKRSLEAYFAVQPRPSGEKIAQIAEKLDLKKNVVRVWFCNQRQKQKRMKFSAIQHH